MKLLKPWLVLVLAVLDTTAQAPQAQGKSPKEVVEQYAHMMADGSLLTAEGWNKANQLFVRPSPPPRDQDILVTSRPGPPDERLVKGNRAEVDEWGIYNLGKIDSRLRYKPSPKNSDWVVYSYQLILTDKHWEMGADGSPIREVTGAWQWKFDATQSLRRATVDAALRYVQQVHDATTDPVIRKNANLTLAVLRREKNSLEPHRKR